MKMLRQSQWLNEKLQFTIADDFDHYVTADTWTTTASDSGTVAASDAVGGIVVLSPSDGSVANNDEVYLATTQEIFKVGTDCHICAESRLKVDQTTDDANIFFGLANAIAADTLVDDGGGMRTTGDIFAIYKVDSNTMWRCVSSVNGTQTISNSTTSITDNTYYTLRIEVRDVDGTNVEATYFVDDQPLRDSNNKAIKHTVAMASATEMDLGCGIKLGADTNHDKLYVDYMFATQTPRPSA